MKKDRKYRNVKLTVAYSNLQVVKNNNLSNLRKETEYNKVIRINTKV